MAETTTTTGHPATPQAQPSPATPAAETLLAGKYKTPQDLEHAYKELEGKLGGYKDLEAKAKIADQITQYGDPNKILEWAMYGANEYQRRQAPATTTTNAPAVTDLLQDWELLPAREQANRLKELTLGELKTFTQQLVQETAKPYVQQFQDSLGNLTRQWDIYRKVMGVAMKNPTVDPEALLKTMVDVGTGSPDNLMSLAVKLLTGEAEADTKAKAQFESWKSDYEQQQRNKEFAAVTGSSGPTWRTPDAPKTSEEAKAVVLKKLLELGPSRGGISPDQV